MKLWHRPNALKDNDERTCFWTNDCPIEPGFSGVGCIVDKAPSIDIESRARQLIVAHVKTYCPEYEPD